jgi:hypothetical protein
MPYLSTHEHERFECFECFDEKRQTVQVFAIKMDVEVGQNAC